LADEKGIRPGNLGQGYVLRRLIRRAIRYGRMIGIKGSFCSRVAEIVISEFSDYEEIERNAEKIISALDEEEERFVKTLEKGLRKFGAFTKEGNISGKDAFLLFQSYGFPIEMTVELAREKGGEVDVSGFQEEFKKHQELSRTASSGQFKSGLADDSEKTTRLHTATHLLNEALRVVLGQEVKQRGSNITPDRLRFDFNFPRKLTDEEKQKIEDFVNAKINSGLDVIRKEMALKDAIDMGAQAEFGARYPDVVSVYVIEDPAEEKGWSSMEICTGPHVENTKEIGEFRILKEEGVAAGVRRIKATVD